MTVHCFNMPRTINNWAELSFPEWWNLMAMGQNRRGLASLSMLIIWEIWNERNNRVFKNKQINPLANCLR
jgi:hypothetical protein